jgi:hypothetical protein
MRKFAISTLIVMVGSILLAGMSCQESIQSVSQDFTTVTKPSISSELYTNTEHLFSVEYPADWDIEEDIAGVLVLFAGPILKDYDYFVNITIAVDKLPYQMTVQDYVKLGNLALKKRLPDAVISEKKSTTISGHAAILETCTATFDNIPLNGMTASFIKDKLGYTFTYDVTKGSTQDYLDCFNLVISTFRFN